MKITIHQKIAIMWLVSAPGIFRPVLESSPVPNAGALLGWGVVDVAIMILVMPMLLRWSLFRRWFGWFDAISDQQLNAILARDLKAYAARSQEHNYEAKVTPYLYRMSVTLLILIGSSGISPSNTGSDFFDALSVFFCWYPIGVLLTVIASVGLSRVHVSTSKGR